MSFHGFDDKTICSDCLISEKFLASCYNSAITESANEQLKRDFLAIYQDTQNCLQTIWNVMHNRGWYQLQMAHQQDITQVQQNMQQEQNSLQQRQAGMMGAGMQAYQPGIGSYGQMGGARIDPGQYRQGS